jgi:hypothetical protein
MAITTKSSIRVNARRLDDEPGDELMEVGLEGIPTGYSSRRRERRAGGSYPSGIKT